MASVMLTQSAPRDLVALDRELARRLDLIEDRPETTLTWSDVARLVRGLAGRAETATRPSGARRARLP